MTYPNQLFSAFAFIGFLFCTIPLYWHLEAWNAGTSLYMAWAGLGCLNAFINSVVWNGTVSNVAPVWCDISTRFTVGLAVGLPAALLVINRRLFKIASRTAAFSSRAERRRALFVDLAIGLGIPLLQMALQIVVEGHRFDIYEEIGCYPNTYNVTLAFPLVLIWPAVISLVSLVYNFLNVRFFWKSSQQLKEILGSQKVPNQNRYIRLIALSGTQIFFILPYSLYSIYFNIRVNPLNPWISWADTHFDYSHIGQFPSVIWRAIPATRTVIEINRWLIVFSAFLFFAFFGFAEEARKHYRLAYSFASSRLRLSDSSASRANSSTSSLDSSFGPGSKKGIATLVSLKGSISPLDSCSRPEMTTKREASLVSDYTLTSETSTFEGVDDQLKIMGIALEEDSSCPTPASTPSLSPVPPPPTAGVGVLPLPPNRLNFPLPHRPTSSYLDLCENV
ncbi:pheromone A receptor-domain-containing protein [Multifurca ochricompacta]|uniref:Pheromone A receptor-domain-containing protein n=1 Tax=Multifurca ochricompacta TaxID=376703 RepID=A0AAD4QLC1_9AGAM|nr:pheromone A receptor-domain-containing protein [Multifurca ochricompacta]